MKFYLYKINTIQEIEILEFKLNQLGLEHTFIIEEDGHIFIGGHATKPINDPDITLIEEKENGVDWKSQWSLFAKNFEEGKAHIQINNKTLFLLPGEGFGDLSHPTTALMLHMIEPRVENEHVIDIGTGSGILALASLLLNAKSAIGIDVDEGALHHAKQNAELNHLPAKFVKTIPKNTPSKNILLMNMILPEQKAFYPDQLNNLAKLWITSGILKSQREKYLALTQSWNWHLQAEFNDSEWLGFIFKPSH